MIEFLKSYGIWIVVGVFFLLMFVRRGCGHGAGCGMGGHHDDTQNSGEDKKEEQHRHSGCC